MAGGFVMGATLQLRDLASDTFRQVTRATQLFNNTTGQATRATDQYRDAQGRLRDSTGRYTAEANRANVATRTWINSNGKLGSSLSVVTRGVQAAAAAFGLMKAKNWLIDSNADMETYKNTLTVVLGSQEKAVKQLEWATKFAAQTPFEIPQIIEATTRMASYGLQADKTLGVIGDMASVMGKDLMQAVEAVADAQTGEVERLKEFGITKDMIAQQAKLMGAVAVNNKGQITDQKAFNAALFKIMETRYKGGMELQSKTFKGMLSNVQDFVGTMGRRLGAPIFEGAKKRLEGFLGFLNKLQESGAVDAFVNNTTALMGQVAGLFDKAGAAAITAFNNIKPFAVEAAGWIVTNWGKIEPLLWAVGGALAAYKLYSGYIWAVAAASKAWAAITLAVTKAQAAFNAVMAFNPIVLVVVAIGALIAILIYAYTHFEGFRKIVDQVFSQVVTVIKQAVEWIKAAFISMLPTLQAIWQGIQTAFNAIMAYLQPIITAIYNLIVGAFNAIWPVVQLVFNVIVGIVQRVLPVIWTVIQTYLTFVYNFWKFIFTAIWTVVQWLWAWIGPYITAALQIVQAVVVGAFNFILGVIKGVMGMIQGVIMAGWAIIKGIWDTITAVLKGDWQAAWDSIVGMLGGVWDGIKQFFGSLGGMLFDCGKAIIDTIVSGIKSAAMAPVNAIKGIFGKVRELLPFSDAKKGPLSNLTLNGSKIMTTIAEGVNQSSSALNTAVNDAFASTPVVNASASINPAGNTAGAAAGSKNITIGNLVEKIELHDVGNKDPKQLVDELIGQLYDRLSGANDIMANADMGAVL